MSGVPAVPPPPGGNLNVLEPDRDSVEVSGDRLAEIIARNDLAAMRALLEAGLDPNEPVYRHRHRTPPVRWAAADDGSPELLALMLEFGGDPNTGNERSSLLQLALSKSDFRSFQVLLSHGASPAAFPGLIHLAASHEDPRFLQALLEKGVDVHVRREYGWTPLLLAVRAGRTDNVRLLLENGANPDDRTDMGESAVDIARKSGMPVALLHVRGGGGGDGAEEE